MSLHNSKENNHRLPLVRIFPKLEQQLLFYLDTNEEQLEFLNLLYSGVTHQFPQGAKLLMAE